MISVRKLAKAGGILFWVILAIVTALVVGSIKVGSSPLITVPLARVFVTFSAIFAQFLSFAIPLIIVGLVTPAIADLGRGAGKWLSITAALAYGSTLFSGFLTYVVCASIFPHIITKSLASNVGKADAGTLKSYFEVEMPPVFGVMTALLLSFVIGIGLSLVPRGVLRKASIEFRAIISSLINKIIIPLLPLHVFGTFLNLAISGAAWRIMRTLLSVVVVVLVLEVVILLTQFAVAGLIGKRNPLKALWTMMPAYTTALGTSSSAATIPVTLRQTRKNGVSAPVAAFTVPLCATIHLAGSTSKITAFSLAIIASQGMNVSAMQYAGFIFMLGIVMVAAPGVPGGAIMAATGVLSSMLGFNESAIALMIATYIALDPFGTATNVTGDGAIAIVIDRLAHGQFNDAKADPENARELSFDGMAYLDKVSVEGVVTDEDRALSQQLASVRLMRWRHNCCSEHP